jgi:hypothetical protein
MTKRYRAVVYVDIYVPDNVTLNDVANETAKKDATFVADQVANQIGDVIGPKWQNSERNYWVGNAYTGGVADTDNMRELLELGQNK